MANDGAAGRLAQAIAERRKELNLTQGELAERVGVDHNTVSRWELGTRSPLRSLNRIAVALSTTPDALIGDDK